MAPNNTTGSGSASERDGNPHKPNEFPRWKRVSFVSGSESHHTVMSSGFIEQVNHHDFFGNELSYDLTTVDFSGTAMLWKNCPAAPPQHHQGTS